MATEKSMTGLQSMKLMQPYLLCLNLNGMNTGAKPKILTLGQGEYDATMLKILLESGYQDLSESSTTKAISILKKFYKRI